MKGTTAILFFTTILTPVIGGWNTDYTGVEVNHPNGGDANGQYSFAGGIPPYKQVGNSNYAMDFTSGGVRTYWGIYFKDGNRPVLRQSCNDAASAGPFSYALGDLCQCSWDSSGSTAVVYGIKGTVVERVDKCGTPTTLAPTEIPTVAPTETPTVAPTEVPTVAPTKIPTVAPTEIPTVAPTEVPTVGPTEVPTIAPTEMPTVVPTMAPTEIPTGTPTNTPTGNSSISPSDVPTSVPTFVPTSVPTTQPPSSECSLIFLSDTISCPVNSSLVGGGIIRNCKTDVCKLLSEIDFSKKPAGITGINGKDVVVQYNENKTCVVKDYDGDWSSENAICRKMSDPICGSITLENIQTSTDSECVSRKGSVSKNQLDTCGVDICWALDTQAIRSPIDKKTIYECAGLDLNYHTETTTEVGKLFPMLCDPCSAIAIHVKGCPDGFIQADISLLRKCTSLMCSTIGSAGFLIGNSATVEKDSLSCQVLNYQKTPLSDTTYACVKGAAEGNSSSDSVLIIVIIIAGVCCLIVIVAALVYRRRTKVAFSEKQRHEILIELHDDDFGSLKDNNNNYTNTIVPSVSPIELA